MLQTEVRPLAGAEPAIDSNEETNGRVEELVAVFELFEPSSAVLTGGAERPA